jgi:excisionase family DNA binding protein
MNEITFETLPKAVTQLLDKLEAIERLLNEKNTPPPLETDEFLTIQEAADLLKLSVPTVYGLVHRAEIPVAKRNKRLYFSRLDLIAWIRAGRKKTNSEIAAEAEAYVCKRHIKRG